jgi:hypothetical protein
LWAEAVDAGGCGIAAFGGGQVIKHGSGPRVNCGVVLRLLR